MTATRPEAGARDASGVWAVVVAALMLAIPLGMVLEARSFLPAARGVPWLIGIPTALLGAVNLVGTIRDLRRPATAEPAARGTLRAFAWLLVFSVTILALGQLVGSIVFIVAFIRGYGHERWFTAVAIAVGTAVLIELLFGRLLNVPTFDGLLLGML